MTAVAGELCTMKLTWFIGIVRDSPTNMLNYRSYTVSKITKVNNAAYNFCNDHNQGLAVWKGAEEYEDIKFLANSVAQTEVFTALNNENGVDCNTENNGPGHCDGKLVWRQNQNGPSELLHAPTHPEYPGRILI